MPTEHHSLTPQKPQARATRYSGKKRGRRVQAYVTEEAYAAIERLRGALSVSDFCSQILHEALFDTRGKT